MERLLWRPDEPENEPVVNLVVNGESEYELNRLNTALFTCYNRGSKGQQKSPLASY